MTATSRASSSSRSMVIQDAARVPAITRAEACVLAETEFDCFLSLAESLAPGDWAKPTACTLWNVQQIVAHVAGAYTAFASWAEFKRQFDTRPARGQPRVDAINAVQVAARAGRTPGELIAELRAAGPRAIANYQRMPLLLRLLVLGPPYPGVGFAQLGYLLDVIFSRGVWIHRLDVCRATGRAMVLTPEHDGRIVAVVLRDLATRVLASKLGGKSVVFELTGPAGGAGRIGRDETPAAIIRMDTLDFTILVSGRFTFEEGRARARFEGDAALAERALKHSQALQVVF